MAISQTQIVDYLNKKVGYSVAKTDTSTAKYPFNESIASPLLTPGQYIWQQDYYIPSTASAPTSNTVVNGSTIVSVYNTNTSAVVQATALSESVSQETWNTGITNWIPPSFGSGYQLKLYAGPPGASASSVANFTQLPVAGSGANDSWFFDYQAGIINFADTSVPAAAANVSNVVYAMGAVYTGTLGITNYANINVVGNITSVNGNLVLTNGNVYAANFTGTLTGGATTAQSANVAYYDVITPLSNNQTYYLEFANVTSGNSVTGAVTTVNVNPSTGTLSATAFSGTTGTFATLNSSGTSTLNTITGASFQGIIGNVTPSTAVFTTATTGGLQAVAIGNVTPGTAVFTTATTGGLQAVAIGNVTPGTAAFTTLSASGVTQLTNSTQATSVTTGALQVTGGISTQANLFVGGNVKVTGNLEVDGILTYLNTTITQLSGSEIVAGTLQANSGTASTSTTSGALQVLGGAGITGAAYIGGGVQNTPIGNAAPNTGAFTTVTGASFQGVIGNVTPSAATFTTVTANTESVGGLQAVAIGNVTPGTGAFTTMTAGSFQGVIGNITPTTAFFTTANATTLQAATIGNAGAVLTGTLSTAAQPNITSTGTLTGLTVSGSTSLNTATGASFQGVIGNVTPNLGYFTTANATNVYAATIGNTNTAFSGATATLTGNATVGNLITAGSNGNISGVNTIFATTVNATTLIGTLAATSVSGTVATANVSYYDNVATSSTNATYYVEFVNATTGNVATYTNSALTYNPSTGNLAATAFIGSGAYLTNINASGITATVPTANVALYEQLTNSTTNATFYVPFYNVATGNASAYTNTSINVNPNTGTLSATAFNGSGTSYIQTLQVNGQLSASGAIIAGSGVASTSTGTGALQVTGGAGITGNLNAGSSTGVHQLLGNVVIGTGNGSAGALTALEVNQNNAGPFNSTSTVHIFGIANTAAKLTVDSVGTSNVTSLIVARSARGTAASPSASQSGDTLGAFVIRGYGATSFNLANAVSSNGLVVKAAQNFTDTAQGTTMQLNVTPLNSNTAFSAMTIDSGGNIVATQTLTVATGLTSLANITANTNLAVMGVSNFTGTANFNGLVTISNTTPTNSTTTGALIVQGGIATSGNINTAGQFFVGTSSQSTVLTGALTVARGTSTTGAGTQYTQSALINGTNTGSSDFIAYANNYPGPNNDHGWMDMGFTGDGFNDPVYSITKANDGYLFASAANNTVGGNLVLSTDYAGNYNDIVIGVGSFYANAEVARFHGNTSNSGTFVVKLPTTNTLSANTGALQVWGGASISGNVYHGGYSTQVGGAVFNTAQASAGTSGAANQNALIVKGANDGTLLYAKPLTAYDAVIIGGSGATTSFPQGAKLVVNSTDSMLLPTGTTAQRPGSTGGTDTVGMLRYNTTSGGLEFYNGTAWQAPSSTITVITDQQFTGTGSTAAFTLSSAATTASTIVSINGVLQIPTLAYSISGTTLTFTENPANGDVIDVRVLTTTSTVSQLNDTTGFNSIQTFSATSSNVGILFTTGVIGGSATSQYAVDTNGGFVTLSPNVTVGTAGIATTVDSLYANNYSSAKYTITATIQGTNIREISELLMVHNGSAAGAGTATVMSYGRVNTAGNTLVTWSATTSGNIAQLQATTTNANTILRIKRDYMAI